MKVAEFLGKYKPSERTVRILMDGSLASELDRARQAVRRQQKVESADDPGLATKVPDLEAKVKAVEEAADQATVEVTVRAVPGDKFDALKLAHPPTEAQWGSYREQAKASPLFAAAPEFDPDGLAPSLIALSVVAVDGEPVEWSESDGVELWSTLHDGARADLLTAAWEVNAQGSSRPFSGTGSDTTPNSGPESNMQQNTESRSLSIREGS
jgi:hypothetical protein